MIVTEEEAKTKRCQEGFGPPMSMAPMSGAGGPVMYASHAAPMGPTFCIGSACMAWRWHREHQWQPNTRVGKIIEPRQGYCGKAGSP